MPEEDEKTAAAGQRANSDTESDSQDTKLSTESR